MGVPPTSTDSESSHRTQQKIGEQFKRHPYVVATTFWLAVFSTISIAFVSLSNEKEDLLKEHLSSLKDQLRDTETMKEDLQEESKKRYALELENSRLSEELKKSRASVKAFIEASWESKYHDERISRLTTKENLELTKQRLISREEDWTKERTTLTERLLAAQKQVDEKPFQSGESMTDAIDAFNVTLNEKAELRKETERLKSLVSEKDSKIRQLTDERNIAYAAVKALREYAFRPPPPRTIPLTKDNGPTYESSIDGLIASLRGVRITANSARMVQQGVISMGTLIEGKDFCRILDAADIDNSVYAGTTISIAAPFLKHPLDSRSMGKILRHVSHSAYRARAQQALLDAQSRQAAQ